MSSSNKEFRSSAASSSSPASPSSSQKRGKSRQDQSTATLPGVRLDMDALFKPDNFVKFFLISAADGSNLPEIDCITGNEELERLLKGKPTKITELRNGNLLVETANRQQSTAIASLLTLAGTAVKIAPHDKMNQVKGTIRYENRPNFTDDQILNALNRYHAVDIYRLRRKLNGALVPMPLYIVTFKKPNLPEYVRIGWTRCNVRIYVPRPRRCFKCQRCLCYMWN